jgi:hypothetical protein
LPRWQPEQQSMRIEQSPAITFRRVASMYPLKTLLRVAALRDLPILQLWSTRYELAQDTCSIVPESGQLHLLCDTRSEFRGAERTVDLCKAVYRRLSALADLLNIRVQKPRAYLTG